MTVKAEEVGEHELFVLGTGETSGYRVSLDGKLVIDAWEHAYYLQYKTQKNDYFAALSNLWNWEDVEQRLTRAQELDLALEDVAYVELAGDIASPVSSPP